MRGLNYLVAWSALLLVVGCAGNESAQPPQAETSPQESRVEIPTVQTEVDASAAAPEKQDDTPGQAIGTKAPAFDLKDQNGQSRSLADILESGSAALVFYRSADW